MPESPHFVEPIARVQIFTHIDPTNGAIRHFNATAMLEYAMCHHAAGLPGWPPGIDLIRAPMDEETITLFLTQRGVEVEYLKHLMAELKRDPERMSPILGTPMIAIHDWDDTTLTVDGHHRFAVWVAIKMEDYPIARFRQGAWSRFLIDLPEAESQRLAADVRQQEEAN